MLAAKAASAPGFYYIGFDYSVPTTEYLPMRPLFVVVKADKCSVSSGGDVNIPTSFSVPVAGSMSLPYVIDFAKCLPETDVTVTANVWDYVNHNVSAQNISIVQSKGATYAMPLTFASGSKSLFFQL